MVEEHVHMTFRIWIIQDGSILDPQTKEHRNKCLNHYDETHPSGLKVLKFVVKNSLMKTSSKHTELISKVETLKLWDQEHEDVEQFCVKLNNVCKQICQYGPAPRDLSLIIAKTFTYSNVSLFSNKMVDIVVQLETNALAYTWEKVLSHAIDLYDSLDTYWSPAGNTALNSNPLQVKIATLEHQVCQLHMNEKGHNKEQSKVGEKKNKMFCFDCGKEGV